MVSYLIYDVLLILSCTAVNCIKIIKNIVVFVVVQCVRDGKWQMEFNEWIMFIRDKNRNWICVFMLFDSSLKVSV